MLSKGSSYHNVDSTATAIMKDGGPGKTVIVVWDAVRRNKKLNPCRLIGANKGLATFHRSILERGNNDNNPVGTRCFLFIGDGDGKLHLIAHLLTPVQIASPPSIPAYVCHPVLKALAEATAGAVGKGRHRERVQDKEETKTTSEKMGAESRLEARLTVMKDAGLFLCEHVCSGSGFPCAYIYKKN